MLEQPARALEYVQVTQGKGIERSRIKRQSLRSHHGFAFEEIRCLWSLLVHYGMVVDGYSRFSVGTSLCQCRMVGQPQGAIMFEYDESACGKSG